MAKKTAAASPPAAPAPTDYTVLARRYRPGSFEELIGQDAIAQALKNAITAGRVAHAYLFNGARGVGKTSTARILAKALNCVEGPTLSPCGECESCTAVAVGEDVDVVEIDGASNRNLDDVRELRVNAQYRPQRSRYKIYIIDEVHMLTRESFNALLKTLEEPPGHVKFIFATTEANKVPITIMSRCQRFEFGGIGTDRIFNRLKDIVGKEGLEADEDALTMLARRGAGSMRDAQSLLDQALAFSAGRLTVAGIHQLLGSADDEQIAHLAGAILDKEQANALDRLQKALDAGVQPGELADQLIDLWRKLMLLKSAGKQSELAELSTKARELLARHVDGLSLESILAGLDILVASKGKLRLTNHPRVMLEMATVRLCLLAELTPLSSLANEYAQMLAGGGVSPRAPTQTMPAAPGPQLSEPAARAVPAAAPTPLAARPAAPPRQTAAVLAGFTEAELPDLWQQILLAAGPMFGETLVKSCRQTLVPPGNLVITFTRAHQREREQTDRKLERIQEILRKLTGQAVIVRTELAAGEAAPMADAAPKASKATATKKAAAQHPLVKQAVDELGAQMLRVDDGFGGE